MESGIKMKLQNDAKIEEYYNQWYVVGKRNLKITNTTQIRNGVFNGFVINSGNIKALVNEKTKWQIPLDRIYVCQGHTVTVNQEIDALALLAMFGIPTEISI